MEVRQHQQCNTAWAAQQYNAASHSCIGQNRSSEITASVTAKAGNSTAVTWQQRLAKMWLENSNSNENNDENNNDTNNSAGAAQQYPHTAARVIAQQYKAIAGTNGCSCSIKTAVVIA